MHVEVSAGVDEHNFVMGNQNDSLASSEKFGGTEFASAG